MVERHLDHEILSRLAARACRAEEFSAATHHLARCGVCRHRLSLLSVASDSPPHQTAGFEGSSYQNIFSRLRDQLPEKVARVVEEKALANQLTEELLALPPERQLRTAQNDPRLPLRSVVELLLARCRATWSESPEKAERYADLALEIIHRLDPEVCGASSINDLLAQRWAYLANVRRIQTDYRAVEDAFALALSFLDLGSGDPLARAEVLDLKASLRRDQRQFRESIELLDQATRAYRRAGDGHLVGRALLKKALVHSEGGSSERSIAVLRQAGELVDPSREPRLTFVISQQLAWFLVHLSRFDEAAEVLPAARQAAVDFGNRFDKLRLAWTEALVEIGQGRVEKGEAWLLETRSAYIAEQIGQDAALISLDLALLYLRQGRTAETRRLAEEMLPIFQSRDIHREALAALMVFRRAAEIETATTTMVEDIARAVERSRRETGAHRERPS